ncbi:MAG TPA: DUF1343 domain-containing protein [Longimicrobiales bacterium]|nr:DUF1343 domain-containing protein [Longimicrobiales bacterium]
MTKAIAWNRWWQRSAGLLLCAAAACGGPGGAPADGGAPAAAPATPAADAAGASPVILGVDALVADSGGPLRGKRVGLITNHTGRGASGESSIDLLNRLPGVKLVALFGPEHGIRGTAQAGESVASGRDEKTGLPVYSLFGQHDRPTPEMLKGIDALVYDIQDVETRYYTYEWTMALSMKSAAENNLDFVVLDRPAPLGGAVLQGNVLDPKYSTFVGLYPVAMRYAMTPGELARYVNAEGKVGARLTVVPMRGWRRGVWYDGTGLPWTIPSPNLPTLEAAAHYPGTCLFEGTNLSVGRGTSLPFEQIGAPWLDGAELARRLNARKLPGVRFEAVRFTPQKPGDERFGGVEVQGVRFVMTDRNSYDAPVAAIAALLEVHAMAPDKLTWVERHFDRLAGTDQVRKQIMSSTPLETIVADWPAQRAAFDKIRQKYLLYR